jgi:murein DD-endopeptidase MepM/ murein hydrolase activator NlpD
MNDKYSNVQKILPEVCMMFQQPGTGRFGFLRKTALTMLVIFITGIILPASAIASVDWKRQQLNRTRDNLRETRKNFEISQTRKQDLYKQLYSTQNQIHTLRGSIAYLNEKISASQKDIRRLREELAVIEKQHDEKQEVLQDRLRDIYLNYDNNFIMVLAGSETFSDFANYADYLAKICEADEQLINTLKMEQEAIRFKQRQLDEKYNKMLSYRGHLRERRQSLENIEKKREELLEQAKRDSQYYLNKKVQLEGHTAELERDIQHMLRSYQTRNNTYRGGSSRPVHSTGRFMWPADGVVTSNFGYRTHPIFGSTRFHTGIDIGAFSGSPIRAADGGTVVYSGWLGGYGNTVMIDHGGGVVTLYAHCSRLYVRHGQSVRKGETIAAVGSTGNSTGPHLHFEVRQDGQPISPWGYLR